MSTPKGMKCVPQTVGTGDKVLIYSDVEHIILQLRHQVPTEEQKIVQAAQALLHEIRTQPGGEQHIQSIVGNYDAQVYGSGSASANVNHPKDV